MDFYSLWFPSQAEDSSAQAVAPIPLRQFLHGAQHERLPQGEQRGRGGGRGARQGGEGVLLHNVAAQNVNVTGCVCYLKVHKIEIFFGSILKFVLFLY
jgi:hypothetical protein